MICAFRIFCLAFCNVDFAFLARVRKKNITRCTRMRRPRLHSVFCTLNVGGMECRMQNRVHKMHRRMEWFGMQTLCATGHVWKRKRKNMVQLYDWEWDSTLEFVIERCASPPSRPDLLIAESRVPLLTPQTTCPALTQHVDPH